MARKMERRTQGGGGWEERQGRGGEEEEDRGQGRRREEGEGGDEEEEGETRKARKARRVFEFVVVWCVLFVCLAFFEFWKVVWCNCKCSTTGSRQR